MGEVSILAYDGTAIKCLGNCFIDIQVGDAKLQITTIVSRSIVTGVDIIIGMDVINMLGGVYIGDSRVKFGNIKSAIPVKMKAAAVGVHCGYTEAATNNEPKNIINDKDFCAKFDGQYWTVEWKYIEGPKLKKQNRLL